MNRMSLDPKTKLAVETYQCPGCKRGCDISCYEGSDAGHISSAIKPSCGYDILPPYAKARDLRTDGIECTKHVPETIIPGIGHIFLGLPTGFNHLGPCEKTKIFIFRKFEDGWGYNMFNRPIWQFLDNYGNTIVRGLCPRINWSWIHIFLEDTIFWINCPEISQEDVDEMD